MKRVHWIVPRVGILASVALLVAAVWAHGYERGYERSPWPDVASTAQADITDPTVEPGETAAEAALYVRQRFIASLNSDSREMQAVVAKLSLESPTKADIVTALGDDASQMNSIFNAKRAMNLAIFGTEGSNPNPSKVIPAIP